MYMVFRNEWGDYNMQYLINQSSYNNEITWYMWRKVSVQCLHHELHNKCLSNIEIPAKCTVTFLLQLGQSHL
jgi:hypothetical protein